MKKYNNKVKKIRKVYNKMKIQQISRQINKKDN